MSQESIWVIDDDRAMRWVLEKTFKEEGLKVTSFEESQSALDRLDRDQPDVIITDPPRAGMHPDVNLMLLRIAAKRIVYVSCNPSTQARDLEALSEKYKVVKIRPVDMFPHTSHVENVALLELK